MAVWVLTGGCLLAAAGFRVLRATMVPELPNFSPVAAIAFCGAFFLPGVVAWGLPLGCLVVSDIVLSMALGYPAVSAAQLSAWAGIGLVVALGRWFAVRGWGGPGAVLGGVLGGGLVFHLVTNAASWLMNPAYPRGFEGLWISLTTGLPGFPPTWVFFRNSIVSDLVFAGIILVVHALVTQASAGRRAARMA